MADRPIDVSLPAPQREDARRMAKEQGLSLSAFFVRLFYLYKSNPVAYESLFQQRGQPAQQKQANK